MVSSPEETGCGVLPAGFLIEREVEPVGRWFLAQWDRINSTRTISANIMSESSEDEDNAVEEDDFEDDIVYLRSLDPKETKEQDHYKVLGISKLRINATDAQIKRAHRQKVLRHHPDKRKAAGEAVKQDDDYFTCITKAFEILGNSQKRRAFDSVDPLFDDDIPDNVKKEQDFFKVFGPVLERNSRWSNKTPVPQLGDDSSSRDHVDNFYSFWYDFDTWREYSYLDEEDKEKASDKWERKEMERINKAQRLERKKDESKRMRKLVDNAYKNDPRIAKFRKSDFDEKAAKKKAKAEAIKAKKEEEERLKKEQEEKEQKEKEEKERMEKEKKKAEKEAKQAARILLKTERDRLRSFAKENNMFAENPDENLLHLTEIENICQIYTIDQITKFNNELINSKTPKDVLLKELDSMKASIEAERMQSIKLAVSGTSTTEKGKTSAKEWSHDELQLLIKAVNLFPAGTNKRWEVVAEFVNQHTQTPQIKRQAKDALSKAKDLQSGNFAMSSMKEEVNKMAFEKLQQSQKRDVKVESEASQRTETPAEAMGLNTEPWSADEQKLLEQALKTFPSSTAERWDRIAECLPGRSKKDCMKRYKELAEIVRAKKAAQAAAAKKS